MSSIQPGNSLAAAGGLAAGNSNSSNSNSNNSSSSSNSNNNDNNNDDNNNNNNTTAPASTTTNVDVPRHFYCHSCGATRQHKRDMANHWRTDHGWSIKKREGLLRHWTGASRATPLSLPFPSFSSSITTTATTPWGPWTEHHARSIGIDRESRRRSYLPRDIRRVLRIRNVRQQNALRAAIQRDAERAESLAKYREWMAGDVGHLETDDGEDWGQFTPADAWDLDQE